MTYRISGHSPSDASSYRDKEELELWEKEDSITGFGKLLTSHKICTEKDLDKVRSLAQSLVSAAFQRAADDSLSPRMDLWKDPDAIGKYMFSNQRIEKFDDRPCESLLPLVGKSTRKTD